jgi:ribosomal protein L33
MSTAISFNCPVCRKRLKVDRQLLGKRLQCQDCKDVFYLKQVSREELLKYESQFAESGKPKSGSSIIELNDSRIYDDHEWDPNVVDPK